VLVAPLGDTATLVPSWRANLPGVGAGQSVTGLAAAPDGRIYAYVDGSGLFEIDPEGSAVGRVGLPPEWSIARVTAVLVDAGEILLLDSSGRLGRFTREGLLTDEIRAVTGPLLWGPRALQLDSGGSLWLGVHPGHDPGAGVVSYPRPVYVRVAAEGAMTDTLWLPARLAERCPEMPDPRFRSGWIEDLRARHMPFVVWSMASDGRVVAGCPSDYRFELDATSSQPLAVTMSIWSPVLVSEEERRDFALTWGAMLATRPGADGETPDLGRLPERKPAYAAFVTGSDGRVWVWTAQPSVTVPANPTWPLAGLPAVLWVESGRGTFDVFEPDGRLGGHVRLPDNVRFRAGAAAAEPQIRGDTLWMPVTDADGAPAVARFEVMWPGTPLSAP
jgi:hypothetical protein